MQILLEMFNETDVLPEQQIGLVQAHALKLYAFPPDPNRIPKWTWQGEEHFPHSCLLPHKKGKYGHFSQPRFCRPSFRGCDKRNAVFGARSKGLSLYFYIKKGI